jgi:hypothetical protein
MLMASVLAGLISAWWLFPLGLVFWMIMVTMVARDPALRLNFETGRRSSLARRFQPYFDRVERARVSVFNSLAHAPAEVRRAMQPVQKEMEALVDRTYGLCHRMTSLDNYRMVAESQSNLEGDLRRIEEAIEQAQDPLVRKEYQESRRTLQARLADQRAIVGQMDRVEAQLLSVATEMDRIVADVLRLQAVGGQEARRRPAQLVRRLRAQQAELTRFEQEALRHHPA